MLRPYHPVVLAERPLPTACDECGEPVTALQGPNVREFEMTGVVHHINGDHRDDRLENLGVMHNACHARHHMLGNDPSPETREKYRVASTGRKLSDAARAKISAANTGRVPTAEHRARQSATMKGRTLTAEHRRAIGDGLRGKKRGTYNMKPMETCPTCGREFRRLAFHRDRAKH
jgi:hypothetical protein